MVPVLYASQWLLTCFACPFSAPVACRVIDALLIENRPHCLLRVALALLAELEPDLLALDDFEELITFIKARPRKGGLEPLIPRCCSQTCSRWTTSRSSSPSSRHASRKGVWKP